MPSPEAAERRRERDREYRRARRQDPAERKREAAYNRSEAGRERHRRHNAKRAADPAFRLWRQQYQTAYSAQRSLAKLEAELGVEPIAPARTPGEVARMTDEQKRRLREAHAAEQAASEASRVRFAAPAFFTTTPIEQERTEQHG